MTAEVAVLNKEAVALAADSAATVGFAESPKIFNTMKIFTLSKYRPIGMMVYSSAEVMDAPLETAIKVFRQQLDDVELPTLDNYYDKFQNFLMSDKKLFSDEARRKQCVLVIDQTLNNLANSIGRSLASRYPGWKRTLQTDVKATAREMLTQKCDLHKSSNTISGATSAVRYRLRKQLKGDIEYWQSRMQSVFFLSKSDLNLIDELCLDLILKDCESQAETGFVLAGFGEEEYFPRLRSFEFESSIMNVHKIRNIENIDMRHDKPRVVPFAQTEMVETFVQGRSSHLDDVLLNYIDGFFESQKQGVSNNPGIDKALLPQLYAMFDNMNQMLRNEFADRLRKFTDEYHVDRIERTVGVMPKEELAKMAQALVNLTAIKRRSTPDAETVGGPIDVAVITKGDGMIWIDRKHYFDASMNLGFTANYYQKQGKRGAQP